MKRLAASLVVAGREKGLSPKERRLLVTSAVSEYRSTMRQFAGQSKLDVWYARLDEVRYTEWLVHALGIPSCVPDAGARVDLA